MKERTLSWWRKKTHTDYKKMIRLLNCDEDGYGKCVTCGARKHYKEAHAGHFKHGLDFIFRNYHIQCPYCNLYKSGNEVEYTIFMLDRYGRECVDDLRSRKTYKYKIYHYEIMRKAIRKVIKKLEKIL